MLEPWAGFGVFCLYAAAALAAGFALIRLCDHIGKLGQAGLPHRRAAHGRGGGPPEIRHVERGETEAAVILNWGRWVMHARPGLLAVRAEAADEENLRRIQDLLTTRLENFGRREHLTVAWRTLTAEARTTARQKAFMPNGAGHPPRYRLTAVTREKTSEHDSAWRGARTVRPRHRPSAWAAGRGSGPDARADGHRPAAGGLRCPVRRLRRHGVPAGTSVGGAVHPQPTGAGRACAGR